MLEGFALALVMAQVGGNVPTYGIAVAPQHAASTLDLGSPGFDAQNSAYVRAGASISVVASGGQVQQLDFDAAIKAAVNRDIFAGQGVWDGNWDKSFMGDTGIVFDDSNIAYTVIQGPYSNLKSAALLWSNDHCKTWHAIRLAGRMAAIEKRDAFNDHRGPPTIISFDGIGLSTTRLWLDIITKRNGAVVPKDAPLLLSDKSEMVPNHSGGANSTFTTRDKIFIVYDKITSSGQGTPSVARQYDRAIHGLEGGEVSLGRSMTEKGPDEHDMPAITADAAGRPTVIIGAHHAYFGITVAKANDSVLRGWTPIEPVARSQAGSKQGAATYSYLSLNTSADGTMNIIARSEYLGLYRLVQLRKPTGKEWMAWPGGLMHRDIATPSRPHYSAWRQRVTMDRQGRLYLNFRYYANELTSQEAAALGLSGTKTLGCTGQFCWYTGAVDRQPATLISSDNGLTWR